MGHTRKLNEAEKVIRELRRQNAELTAHAWTLQLVSVCLLERFCQPNGSCLLPLELRQKAIDSGWGVRTEVLPDTEHLMAVSIDKPNPEKVLRLAESKGAVVVPAPGSKKKR